jgi:predicted MPP superfamily phosphohydrolase
LILYVLAFLLATNLYLFLKLRSCFGNGWWTFVYAVLCFSFAALPFASRAGYLGAGRVPEVLFSLAFTWTAIVGMACVGFFFMDTASFSTRVIDRLAGTSLNPRFFDPRKCVPVTLFLILSTVLYSYYEAWNVRRVDLTIETSKLPEGTDRLRLAHLTDVHLGGLYTVDRLRRVMDIVRSAEPDILVMTGDIVDGDMSFWEEEARLLASHGAKQGAYAVTGNHEFYVGVEQTVDFMRRARVVLLCDARVDAAGIAILGLDDPAKLGWGATGSETLPGGLYFPEDRFVLLLKHRPQVIEGSEGKFDLQLSGHTHGGQIWPFRHVVRWANKHTQHLSYKGSGAVYVSNGAGFWGPPLRFLTPPEVTIIDLVRH